MSVKNNDVIKTISSLRSIKKFSAQEISNEDLKEILSACVCAANASARQNYSIIVVDDKETLEKLFYGANIGLIFCVDYNRLIKTAEHLGHSFNMHEIRHFITGTVDTILAAQTCVIAAKSLGIDSLFTNSIHRGPLEEIYDYFKLPKQFCFPLVALCLGFAAEEPSIKKGRWSGAGLIHKNKYHDLTIDELDEIVEAYESEEKHLALRTKEQLKEMGFEKYLDWYFTKWNGPVNQAALDNFYDILKKAKFVYSNE